MLQLAFILNCGLTKKPNPYENKPQNNLFCYRLWFFAFKLHGYKSTIADSNSRVNFTPQDFTITGDAGQATVTKILGIDFKRLFTQRGGESGGSARLSIPIVGGILAGGDRADEYAMYELITTHPGYDALFYPQIKRKSFNFLYIYQKSTSQVKARLGKLKGLPEGDKDIDFEKE